MFEGSFFIDLRGERTSCLRGLYCSRTAGQLTPHCLCRRFRTSKSLKVAVCLLLTVVIYVKLLLKNRAIAFILFLHAQGHFPKLIQNDVTGISL